MSAIRSRTSEDTNHRAAVPRLCGCHRQSPGPRTRPARGMGASQSRLNGSGDRAETAPTARASLSTKSGNTLPMRSPGPRVDRVAMESSSWRHRTRAELRRAVAEAVAVVTPIARPYRWPRFPLKRHRFQCSRRARTLLSVVGTRAACRGNAASRPSTYFSPRTEPHPERPITAPQPRALNPYRLERSSSPTGSRIDRAVTAVAMTTANTVAVTLAILITAVLALSAIMASNPSAASMSRPSTERIPANATPSSEHNAQLIDFNNPATLAWSLELGGTTNAALHDATCTHPRSSSSVTASRPTTNKTSRT